MQKILVQLSKHWQKKHHDRNSYLSLQKVFKMMTQEFTLGQAADFIVHFGIFGVAYCYGFCRETPTNPKMWARAFYGQSLESMEATEREAEKCAQNRFLPNKRAGWHCPNDRCGKRYSRGVKCNRVFFTVDLERLQAMQMQNVEFDVHSLPVTMFRIDELDPIADAKISILKVAKLLKFVGPDGRLYQFTYRSTLYQLAKFNEGTDRKLRAAFSGACLDKENYFI